MKANIAIAAALALLRFVAATGRSIGAGSLQVAGPSPAPGPEAPGMEALHITFEIMNFNYYDLTKVTCPKMVKVKKAKKTKKPSGPSKGKQASKKGPGAAPPLPAVEMKDLQPNMTKAIGAIHGNSDKIAKEVEDGLDDANEGPALPWMKKKGNKKASLLQMEACAPLPDLAEAKSKECTTVMDVLRDAVKETVRGIIRCLYLNGLSGGAPGPAPAPMAAGALEVSGLPAAPPGVSGLVPLPPQPAVSGAFLSPAPAPFGAPAPAGAVPDVNIFVTFSPGREIGAAGRSTMVEIAFLDTPSNALNDAFAAMPAMQSALDSGLFKKQMHSALHKVTGIKPKLHKVGMGMKTIEHWPIHKCEGHIKGIVKQFSMHYSRDQVPRALYNECTNFMTKMSFSHDYVLDPMDTVRCKKATAKFAKRWEAGELNSQDSDFEDMCIKACEAKYGRNAPKCNLHVGDGLATQPQL